MKSSGVYIRPNCASAQAFVNVVCRAIFGYPDRARAVAYTCPDRLLVAAVPRGRRGPLGVASRPLRRALARSVEHAGVPDDAAAERLLSGPSSGGLGSGDGVHRGLGIAWDHFVDRYRPVLHRAADAIDSGGGARELADALYGELFGVSDTGGQAAVAAPVFPRAQQPGHLAPGRAGPAARGPDRATRRFEPLAEDDETPAAPDAGPRRPASGRASGVMRRALRLPSPGWRRGTGCAWLATMRRT